MRKLYAPMMIIFCTLFFATVSCNKREKKIAENQSKLKEYEIPFDSGVINDFFSKHPKLKGYQAEVESLYSKHEYHYVWYDKNGINEFGNLLYDKINNLDDEGVQAVVPYKDRLDEVYEHPENGQKPNIETELLSSSLYFFYAHKVFHGLDAKKTTELEWYLPRKKQSFVTYLDSLLANPALINKNEQGVLSQYYRLKTVLQRYRELEKKGGWKTIVVDSKIKSYKPGDSAKAIAQIRERLFITGDIRMDSKSAVYDKTLVAGVLKYKQRNGNIVNKTILPEHIQEMNVPIADRIKTIMINMERCRWISNDITKSKEFIVINIPSYQLTYFKDGKPELRSDVVVGKALNKTVIFSATMKYIVFSPYWNVPTTILKKEILPGIDENPNYLEEHEMEWFEGNVRQRPGPQNSLGKVKFLFPNSNNIYLHDTPSKNLFNSEDRAFSHGCIRVQKPAELAKIILKDDKNWTREKIDEAMDAGVESWYTLKNKIPVYIGYFTAWVDDRGAVHFYQDIYERDPELASLIFKK
ncbi:murein L,D-transpeptidase [Flavobacterium sp. GT3R68]|uniref:L,D-transpeptidase family protein n=1 Tax=Flavobacterium sp. GT3R68 TaxID=2594437 RepID=UPI000F89CB28|nr:L,D-transpeptidase family protein [Flavobacterium sp. GT3R68]RTY96025.1 L,D-transpeptidase [Flavobacterium sp. GSN2]TRW93798.1 L,D-transpeptidase family protein [Flavobacterium sp. GT3R68]